MSNTDTVGYECECYQQVQGMAWNAIGASTATEYYGGINYTIYFVNNTASTSTTSGVSFDYDLSPLADSNTSAGDPVFPTGDTSSLTGTVAPGATVSVTLATGTQSQTHSDAGCMCLQVAAAALMTNITDSNYQVCFWFSTDGDGGSVTQQQIAICDTGNGTTLPISSLTYNSSSENKNSSMVAESASTGLKVYLNGGGNSPCTTQTIYIQLYNN